MTTKPGGAFSRTGFAEPADVARCRRHSEHRGRGFLHCEQQVACFYTIKHTHTYTILSAIFPWSDRQMCDRPKIQLISLLHWAIFVAAV